ncbi:MAG: asparagine synthase (glutamine-hydrolyzing) [Chromatiaceae bacterium]|nr:asparagine synthase (glutamine-hydrolyzing) [Chromatiaceae bacterium]
MCGIVGLFNRSGPVRIAALETAVARLAHRGPDDQGTFVSGHFGMGHTRLSIIDLAGGHQPLKTADGTLTLIANGEIYNFIELRALLESRGHRFLTHSDCEVILHAYREYGENFLKHILGMFAFALFDSAHDRLILARDRLGIKPLFLAVRGSGVAFASEIKGLLPLLDELPDIDALGLARYFQNQFAGGATTLLQGVERVLPGESVWIEQGRIARRYRYWSPLQVQCLDLGFEEASTRFDALMEVVITEHMRSDVPFGLFLSGGVDSAVLLAQLSQHSDRPIRTFSVGFPGTSVQDELPLAQMISRRFGSQHREICPSSRDILQSFPLTIWAADELMRDNANMPTALLAQAAGQELKVVFSGEGGDEVFAGYGRYRSSPLELWFKNLLNPGSMGFRTRGTFRGGWPRQLFTRSMRAQLPLIRQLVVDGWRQTPAAWSDLQRRQYIDLTQALPDNLLVKADRMMMAWGLEGRVPFLDHRLVEFGLGLPDKLKVAGGVGKLFLKRWARRDLPEEYLFARKRGFYVPLGDWMGADLLGRLNTLLPEHPALRPWFRPDGVRALIARCRDTRNGSAMLWAIIQFVIWTHFLRQGFAERPAALTDPLELIRDLQGFEP